MRRSDAEILKAAVQRKPIEKIPRGHPKKQWIEGLKKDLEKLEAINCMERVHKRKEWKEVSVAAKLLKSCDVRERERERNCFI